MYFLQINQICGTYTNDDRYLGTAACSFELSAAYFQPANSVFLSHKSANSTFNRLFSAQANKPGEGE
jgi:hypothetical protein